MAIHVSLPPDLARFVRQQIDSGRYSTPAELVREALRRLADAGGNGDRWPLRALSGDAYDRSKAEAAVRGIHELQRQQTLGADLTVEDLIRAGRDA